MSFDSEHALAVLVDIENMARPGARNRGEFDIHLVLNLLAEKGRVVVKRAYADWSRYRDARRELMNAGLELIEMPSAREGAKNRADIKMAVDAMEIAYSRAHVTNFVIVSGDSDFTPLVGKLRELNKRVIGIGRDGDSSSTLLIANCDEFYFYDNIARKASRHHVEGQRPDALSLLRETLEARGREGDEHPQASAVKDSMRRRDPAFSENDIGYSTFSKFLEDAQTKGIVRLLRDPRSGTYLVELLDGNGAPVEVAPAADEDTPRGDVPSEGRRRRRRRRGGEGDSAPREATDGEEIADDGAEVFEFKVPTREPEVELPPLDQPLSYEDLLADVPTEDGAESAEPPTRGARRRRKPLATTPEVSTEDLEADSADGDVPAATEDAPTASEDAPTRPGRRRRSSSRPAAAEVAVDPIAIDEPAVDVPVAQAEVVADASPDADSPAPTSRRRVKRGTVLPTIAGDEAAAEVEAPSDEDAKPKRRATTTRKKATDADTAETPADDDAKPKRRTTRKKATDTDSADAGISSKESPY